MLKDKIDYFLSSNKNYKMFTIHDNELEKRNIKLLIAPQDNEYFEDMDIFKDYLVVYYKNNGLHPHLLIHNLKTGENSRHKVGDCGEVQPCLNKVINYLLRIFILLV